MGSIMGWYNRDRSKDKGGQCREEAMPQNTLAKWRGLLAEIAQLREAVRARDKLLQEIAPDVSYHCFAWFEEQRAALCNKS